MTKQTLSKIAEVVLVLAFCMLSIYITLVGTVFVGTPLMLTHQSINGVAQRLMILRPCIKKNGAVERKTAAKSVLKRRDDASRPDGRVAERV